MDNYQIARRAQIGVIIPSTNTGVEYDLQQIRLDGVTWHPSRFWIELRNWSDEMSRSGDDENTVFERFLEIMRGEIPVSIRNILSAKVSHIMLGMSAETFWGGLEGNIAFEREIRDQIGDLGLTTGAGATKDALNCFGAKRISVITPYPQVGDDNVRRFFSDIGFEVVKVKGMSRPSATAIAETSIQDVLQAVREVDGDDVDAIIQCGTNLSTIDVFPTLEHCLQKPLIPINMATVWHALRACGIEDRIIGKGRLLEEF
ncbi:Asp/Glu racemase [Microbulbifer hydrolyticus]|uniref:Asp/Glu racemase n=1 Tax=Microbulbifer hydrolyticus TaxID=48074 RepID=A0A6P1TCN9_9GAMM|nr:Asp/Glu racemase [Microbulbifer hydrolyticus]MBB5210155.1 maleate isomerase [Microbulbifer hydrolyticus]QHQ39330.1 Asp/Glu racemase [Microbulbifer hydrolyticus]